MLAKSGDSLLDEEALAAMKAELLGRAFLLTPNIPEAEALTGLAIRSDKDRREAARAVAALGPAAVLIKGGHFPSENITDLLYTKGEFVEFPQSRVPGRNTHGTGCTFSAAITAHLARGHSLREAIPLVQQYVADAIRHAPGLGRGAGPMGHFYKWKVQSSK
jgi:hydroxymethylpyrimidine/phosphomethylpyrimidine kinase